MLRPLLSVLMLTLLATSTIATIAAPAINNSALSTIAERSGFKDTGRYDEVITLCAAYQKAYPANVRCINFGRTPEDRPMLALIATKTSIKTAEEARKKGVPVILVQGGIHAGEIDGKDAGFLALREALDDKSPSAALTKQVLIFVPVFNIDGHERFGKWNRPNQVGPTEMGWRTTGQNYNLNRDYAKADSPEMQAMLRLVNQWDPIATIDLHVTDGAKFEHDIAIMVEPVHAGELGMRAAGRALRDSVIADLAAAGSLPLPFYPSFTVDDDPQSGFVDSVSPPRFSTGYFHTRNRMGMLVETHSWKNYAARVHSTHVTVRAVLKAIAHNGQQWLKAAQNADVQSMSIGGKPIVLSYKAIDKSRTIDFKGYEYTRTMSDISGAMMTRYDDKKPQIWKLSVRDDVQPNLIVVAPKGGYVVAAAHADWVGEKLKQHGIQFQKISDTTNNASLEIYRAEAANLEAKSNEGHQRINLKGAWKAESRTVQASSLFVPIAQAKSTLVMSLFEPAAPDALVAWGSFNTAFEQKEYMEAYVAEEVAREQLAADPALFVEFMHKVTTDDTFAKSPQARLEFFARRHSSWDERFNLYPVMRSATVWK
jgi:Zinc carboxypeptidase